MHEQSDNVESASSENISCLMMIEAPVVKLLAML